MLTLESPVGAICKPRDEMRWRFVRGSLPGISPNQPPPPSLSSPNPISPSVYLPFFCGHRDKKE